VRVPGLGQDDVGHGRGEAPDPGPVRGADHAVVQVRGRVAAVGRPLAGATAHVAAPQPHRAGQDRGVRPAVQGQRHHARQTELNGGRRVGHVVHGRREPAALWWLPEAVPEHTQDAQGQAPGPSRQPDHQLSHQDAAAVRVRKTPTGRRVGGDRHCGPHQRHTAAAHLVPAVPPVSALLHPAPGPVQGQDPGVPGERVQTRVAPQPRDTNQLQGLR